MLLYNRHATVLILFIILVFVSRIPGIYEPLERDITGYAVIGHEILNGKSLYTDIWDHKPPGVYLAFSVAEFLFGYSQLAIYLLGAILSALTLLGVYSVIYKYNNNIYYASGAAMLWLLMSIDIKLQANQPNVEVFLNMFLVWILFIAFNLKYKPLTNKDYFTIGALLFAASFFKTIVAFMAFPLWLAVIYIEKKYHHCVSFGVIKKSITMVLAGAIGWAGLAGYYVIAGGGGDFYGAVFSFNQSYAGNMTASFLEGLKPFLFFPGHVIQYSALYFFTILGIALSILKKYNVPIALLLIACLVGVYFSVSAPGFFYPHYYQLWIPVLIIGSAVGVDAVRSHIAPRYHRMLNGVVAAIFLYLCYAILPMYSLTPYEWSVKKYGETFVEAKQFAEDLNNLLGEDESIYEWGAETGLYFYTQKRPNTKIIFVNHILLSNDISRSLLKQTFDELNKSPPDLFIVNTDYLPVDRKKNVIILGGNPILEWFKNNYDIYNYPLSSQHYIGGALKGSNLSLKISKLSARIN